MNKDYIHLIWFVHENDNFKSDNYITIYSDGEILTKSELDKAIESESGKGNYAVKESMKVLNR